MARGPWYISARAVRDYLALTGRPAVSDGPVWDRAEDELIRIAIEAVAAVREGRRQPKSMETGASLYRGAKPTQWRLIVTPSRGPRDLPQLVSVQPAWGTGDKPPRGAGPTSGPRSTSPYREGPSDPPLGRHLAAVLERSGISVSVIAHVLGSREEHVAGWLAEGNPQEIPATYHAWIRHARAEPGRITTWVSGARVIVERIDSPP